MSGRNTIVDRKIILKIGKCRTTQTTGEKVRRPRETSAFPLDFLIMDVLYDSMIWEPTPRLAGLARLRIRLGLSTISDYASHAALR